MELLNTIQGTLAQVDAHHPGWFFTIISAILFAAYFFALLFFIWFTYMYFRNGSRFFDAAIAALEKQYGPEIKQAANKDLL